MDMSDVAHALQISTGADGSQPTESLFAMFERTLISHPTEAVLEAMSEVLDSDEGAEVLRDSALTYTPLLIPLLPSPNAQKILQLVAMYSSPREFVLALNEGLQVIEDEATGVDLSDDEDEDEESGSGEEENKRFRTKGSEFDWSAVIGKLICVLQLYTIVIPRLPNARSTPTLIVMSDALSLFPIFSPQTNPQSARELLLALCELVDASWNWSLTREDKGGEQKAILTEVLLTGVTLFGARVEAGLAARALLSVYPRYSAMYTIDESGISSLHRALASTSLLNLDLVELLTRSSTTSLASLILLASKPPSERVKIPLITPILAAALGGTCVDAGIVMAWQAVEELDFDNATLLLELLSPLATSLESSIDRLSIAKLITTIISFFANPPTPTPFTTLYTSTSDRDVHLLLLQLLEPSNPFEHIRLLALSIIRDPIILPHLLSTNFATHTAPVIFTLPSSSSTKSSQGVMEEESDPFSMGIKEFVSSIWPNWFTEVAMILRLVMEHDKDNKTGLKSGEWREKVKRNWLDPVKLKIEELVEELKKVESEGKVRESWGREEFLEAQFMVERLDDAVNRANECLEAL